MLKRVNIASQVANCIERDAEKERRPVGARLPSVRVLSKQLGVSSKSANEALKILEKRGLVELRPREGAFLKVNLNASTNSKRQLQQVGIVWASRSSGRTLESLYSEAERWSSQVIRSAEEALNKAAYHSVSLSIESGLSARASGILDRVDQLGDNLAGIITFDWSGSREMLSDLDSRNIPWVTINPKDLRSVYNFVEADNLFGGRRLGKCLALMNIKRVVVLSSGPLNEHVSGMEKVLGLYNGYLEAGVCPSGVEQVICPDCEEEDGYRLALSYLKKSARPPEVIFATGDLLAVGAIRACRECGLNVPEDVGVVGATGLQLAQYVSPPLTVLLQPTEMMGRHAGNMLIEMMREGVRRIVGRRIPSPIIFRESLCVPDELRLEIEQQYEREAAALN
ncbi:MAG: GntR family transcriptional regulator [Phycisphaerae bacterium]|nr:GntR family transcriptional regulator [Phycisphaerae bacterium]